MNFDEGFRRVGLVLGLLGAATGFTVAFFYGSDLVEMHAGATKFKTLAATYWRVVREHPLVLLTPDSAKRQTFPSEGLTPEEMGLSGPPVEHESLKRQNEALNANGIKSAHVDNGRVLSLDTTDDKTIVPAEPALWSWFALPAMPLFGFLIPWGTIRTIIWIKHGFSHKEVKS